MVRAVQLALARRKRRDPGLPARPGRDPARGGQRLRERIRAIRPSIRPLYGALIPPRQDLRHRAVAAGRRKVVLATAIAQTQPDHRGRASGDRRGLARVPRYDPASGLTRLATVRVSRASADQRRGTGGADRTGRLLPACGMRLRPAASRLPTGRRSWKRDLTRLALDLARWGTRDARRSGAARSPVAGGLERAREDLREMGALDDRRRPDQRTDRP